MLAHGAVLRKNGFSAGQVAAVLRDYHQADLEPAEVAMMEYAEQMTRDAGSVTAADVDRLRQHGFSDEQILDIAMTAAARNFYSKLLDALGAEPDAVYQDLEPEILNAVESVLQG